MSGTTTLKMKVRGILGGTRALRLLSRWRRWVPVWLWKHWPVCGSFTIDIDHGRSIRIAKSSNDWLERVHFWQGLKGDEPETYPVFMSLARDAGLVLDIGASNGIYTLLACAAGPNAKVMAFEPSPRVYEKLVANVAANGWSGRCELRNQAVADRQGPATFHAIDSATSGKACLYPDRLPFNREGVGSLIEVEVTTVDEACAAGGRVGLAKIDVEGYEDQVLKGMSRILAENGPDLVVECLPEGPLREIEEIIGEFGYRIYHIQGRGLVRMDEIVPDPEYKARNFLFTLDPDILERLR